MMRKPTPEQLLAVLRKPMVDAVLKTEYPRIARPFTLVEAQDFLEGRPGATVPLTFMTVDRSYQFRQCLSAIGACLVDQKRADDETIELYEAVWRVETITQCRICQMKIRCKLMFPQDLCGSVTCHIKAVRENI